MSTKKYQIKLSDEQRNELKKLTTTGIASARKINRARILLLGDEKNPNGSKTDKEIAEVLDITRATIVRVHQRFIEQGLEEALNEKPRSGRPNQLSGKQKAQITALACSAPPEGRARWTLRLLATKLVELEIVETISYNAVGEILKKNELKPHLKRQWCLGKLSTLFLWRMEQILELYEQPYNPKRPQICFDERPCQLIDDILTPLPMGAGKTKREDYHYKRNGVCTIFIAFEPLMGQRFIQVRKRRTKVDYAQFMNELAQIHYPDAEKIVLVQDNLNTHSPGSFYQAFKPEYAFALAQRFEMHYTPTKASWLNMVEIELSVFSKQCLDRRIGQMEILEREVLALAEQRNEQRATVHWQFTKNDARHKFKKFYPVSQS